MSQRTPTVTVTRGVSASGKTRWATQMVAKAAKNGHIIFLSCRDDIRWEIMRERGINPSWKKWKWKDESEVTRRQDDGIRAAIEQGHDIIIADTNLRDSTVNRFRSMFENTNYDFVIQDFHCRWEEAIERDAARPNGVGYSVLAKQFASFYGKEYAAREGRPKAVIVDIDGTMAHMNGKRGPFEWDRVEEDECDEIVATTIRGLYYARYTIIVTSGRDAICREQTQRWLNTALNCPHYLLMRDEGDQRPDDDVKEEIFRDCIEPYYDVVAVFDDRPKVCRRWRQMGLKVFQLGNPYIEF